MTLPEYIRVAQDNGKEVTYASIARDIPCHFSYIGKIASGRKMPSYTMARRIEQVTDGAVPRTNWYPNE